MIKEAINRILEIASPELLTVQSRTYASKHLEPIHEPQPKPLQVSTLTSFIEYVLSNVDQLGEPFNVHISAPDRVCLISRLYGPFRQRDVFIEAIHREPSEFKAGTYYELEKFCILLRTSFCWTDQIADLLRLFGNVRGEQVAQWSDDGISQSVQARRGIALVEEVQIPSPVMLYPYRTFREVQQPESQFIVRAKSQEGKAPAVALFECDGDQWKLRAVETMRDFLRGRLPDNTVILA